MKAAFAIDRWADAFISVCAGKRNGVYSLNEEENNQVEEGLAVLRAAATVFSVYFHLEHGTSAAAKMKGILNAALQKSGYSGGRRGIETALAVFFLLVQKNHGKHTGALCGMIEKKARQLTGALEALIETPREPDAAFLESLKAALVQRTGMKTVQFQEKITPELIGGCRIWIGSERLDYSIAGEIKRLKKALQA